MSSEMLFLANQQHRLVHDIYVLMDDGDRRVLAPLNLSPLEFAVLQQLDMSQGRRLTDVGATLLCVKSTITRIVDRLERDGLVLRTPDPDDRRAQRLVLTEEGAAVRSAAIAAHNTSIQQRFSVLSPAEQRQFHDLLAKLRCGLRDLIQPEPDTTTDLADRHFANGAARPEMLAEASLHSELTG